MSDLDRAWWDERLPITELGPVEGRDARPPAVPLQARLAQTVAGLIGLAGVVVFALTVEER